MGATSTQAGPRPVQAIVWPPVSSSAEAAEVLARLVHHLGGAERLRLHLPVDDPAIVVALPEPGPEWGALLERCSITPRTSLPPDISLVLLRSVDADRYPGRVLVGTFVIDPASPDCAADLARVAAECRDTAALVERGRPNLDRLLGPTRRFDELHVLGGAAEALPDGPTVADAAALLGSGALRNLVAVTLAAPRWVGSSSEDAARRAALVDLVGSSDAVVVCTTREAALLAELAPGLAMRLAVLPVAPPDAFPNVDLRDRPQAAPPADDLTMLLLPLAATLARRVVVHGVRADARPGRATALQVVVRAMEERLVSVRSATDTDEPTLRRRQLPLVTSGPLPSADFVLLSPNHDGGVGHHAAYAQATMAAARGRGLSAVTLAARSLTSAEPDVIPFFTYPLAPLRGYATQADVWHDELRRVLADVAAPGGLVFMDGGAFQHLAAFAAVAADHPDRRVVVNLMSGHAAVEDAALDTVDGRAARAAITSILGHAQRAGVAVTVDTEALRDDVLRLTGFELPVLPMSSVLAADDGDGDGEPPRREPNDPPRVLFPAQVRAGRGLDLLESLAVPLLEGSDPLQVMFRTVGPDTAVAPRVRTLLARLADAGVEFVTGDGDADRSEYRALLRAADVVVLPYDPAEFRTRTSGLVADCLLAGTPVVTSSRTWGASVVEREGGVSGPYDDPAAYVDAIRDAVARSGSLRAALDAAQGRLRQEFAVERRLEFLTEVGPPVGSGLAVDEGVLLSGVLGASSVRAGVGLAGRVRELERAQRAADAAALVGRDRITDEILRTRSVAADLVKVRGERDRLRAERAELKAERATQREELARVRRELAAAQRPWPRKVASRIKRAIVRPR